MAVPFIIVGLGNIGKRHAKHIQQNTNCKLVATCDIDTTRKIEGVPFYTSLAEMLQAHPEAEVLNVCTPNYLHAEHTLLGLSANKHIVCEKPMARSTAECDAMIAASEKAGKHIFVVKQNRYNPPVQAVKNLITQNALGKLYFVNINCFWNRNKFYYDESDWRGKQKEDGGIVFTQFSHFVDILYYLVGEVKVLHAVMQNYNHPYLEVEDAGTATMMGKDGCLVNFNFSTCATDVNMEGAITIIAEKGTVKIGGQYLNTIEYQKINDIVLPSIEISNRSNDYGRYQGSMSNHDKIIENVVATLSGNSTVMTNAVEGRSVVQIIEDIYKASKGN